MQRRIHRCAFVAACLVLATVASGGSDPATVSITATVDAFAEWADHSPTIAAADWSGHIADSSTPITVTKALTLYTNVNVTITPTTTVNSGILTNGSATLTTSYQITGDVGTPDAGWKAAGTDPGEFFNAANTYAVTHVSGTGSYTINLLSQASSPAPAPNSGNYTCNVVLTASWT